jgi:uncharacterized protein (DUF2141 family)
VALPIAVVALPIAVVTLLGAVVACAVVSCAAGAGSTSAPPRSVAARGAPARVNVSVGTFRSTSGVLACRLYASGDGFPMDPKGGVEQRVPVREQAASCSFAGVTPGTYAVAVVHDENDNGKLDTNFFGAPTEGYGVSNNHTYAFAAPEWEESKFDVEPGKDVGLGIVLRY